MDNWRDDSREQPLGYQRASRVYHQVKKKGEQLGPKRARFLLERGKGGRLVEHLVYCLACHWG